MKPIIICQPPALGSSNIFARQAYYNSETDRAVYKWDGPPRESHETSESSPKREHSVAEDAFKRMGTRATKARKAPPPVYDEDTIVISSSSPPPAPSYHPSNKKEEDDDPSPRPLRGGSKRKTAPAAVLDDSDFDNDLVSSTHQPKKKKQDDNELSKNKRNEEVLRDNKGKKAGNGSRGTSGNKVRITGKARFKSAALVEDSETDELETNSTPDAPSRPKPRPAYKGATGLGTLANQPSTSSPNIAGSPIAPAVDSTIPAAPLPADPQPVFTVTKAEEAKPAEALNNNPAAFPPLHGLPVPPIAHHGPPPPHSLQYNHFPGYSYPLQAMGPQHHFAGAPVQRAYGGSYPHHPSYPSYHPQPFYPQGFLPPPPADPGHQVGTSTSRSTPHE